MTLRNHFIRNFYFLGGCLLIASILSLSGTAWGGVSVSIIIAPPPLPVYEQPPCPDEGYIWTPGYWAYGHHGYYWVPGTWVLAPEPGLLWTPGYWGWNNGTYLWHAGYWGPHVGFYGGVNYGFGYFGIGFVGGRWHGRDFHYNTGVTRVNVTHVHNTYIEKTVINNTTAVNGHGASFNGPGGVAWRPSERENRRPGSAYGPYNRTGQP